MSLYEILAVAALVIVGISGYLLYLWDTKPWKSGAKPPPASGEPIFKRDRTKR